MSQQVLSRKAVARALTATVLALVMTLALSLTTAPALALAAFTTPYTTVSSIPDERLLPLVVDDADLLTGSEESRLITLLERLSEENRCEIAVVTVDSLDGYTPESYADDFFDYNGYGYGDDRDGILLLISMEERDWHVTTHGRAYRQLTQDRFEWLMEDVLPLLSSGDYYDAFVKFGNNCAELMQMSPPSTINNGNGGYVTNPDAPQRKYITFAGVLRSLAIASIVGALISWAVTSSKAKKHQTVLRQIDARSYLQSAPAGMNNQPGYSQGSMDSGIAGAVIFGGIIAANLAQALILRGQSDTFVRSDVSRTERGSSDSGGRGSGSSGGYGGHTSSSGSSHGGGGGKF